MTRIRRGLFALAVLLLAVLTACGSDSAAPASRSLSVSAAASTTNAFTDLGARFETAPENPEKVALHRVGEESSREGFAAP